MFVATDICFFWRNINYDRSLRYKQTRMACTHCFILKRFIEYWYWRAEGGTVAFSLTEKQETNLLTLFRESCDRFPPSVAKDKLEFRLRLATRLERISIFEDDIKEAKCDRKNTLNVVRRKGRISNISSFTTDLLCRKHKMEFCSVWGTFCCYSYRIGIPIFSWIKMLFYDAFSRAPWAGHWSRGLSVLNQDSAFISRETCLEYNVEGSHKLRRCRLPRKLYWNENEDKKLSERL